MGHLFRSEEMAAVELTVLDGAKDHVILELGAFGKFHPIDLSLTADLEQQSRYMIIKKQLHETLLVEKQIEDLIHLSEEYRVTIPELEVDENALESLSLHDVHVSLQNFHESLKVQMNIAQQNRVALAYAIEYSLVLHYTKAITEEAAVIRQKHRALLQRQERAIRRFSTQSGGAREEVVELSPLSSTSRSSNGSPSSLSSLSLSLGSATSEEETAPTEVRPRLTPLRYEELATRTRASTAVYVSSNSQSSHSAYSDTEASDGEGLRLRRTFTENEPQVEYIAAMARTEDCAAIQRSIYRISRGNAYVQAIPVETPLRDPINGKYINCTVLSVIVFGKEITTRIQRSMILMGARVYEVPKGRYEPYLKAAEEEIDGFRSMLQATERHIVRRLETLARRVGKSHEDAAAASARDLGLLSPVGRRRSTVSLGVDMSPEPSALNADESHGLLPNSSPSSDQQTSEDSQAQPMTSPIRDFLFVARRERLAAQLLLKAAYTRDGIILRGWVPTRDLDELKERINNVPTDGVAKPLVSARAPLPNEKPPTYFVSDKFTTAFQDIVNTYGIPRYQEVNPGLFTIVTFPFLFGIMFGDIGHGFMLTMVGVALCIAESALKRMMDRGKLDTFGQFLYHGRYIILLMGIFALYCGSIYNDLFSLMPDIFGSGYNRKKVDDKTVMEFTGKVYPWGIDPAWGTASNSLIFQNSFKMKMSIVVGVVHMLFGTLLSVLNHQHFGNTGAIWFEFVPRLLFMLSIFGYLVFLIILKWSTAFASPSLAPNLTQTMINMFLRFGDPGPYPLYPGQAIVQKCLVIVAMLMVPLMFFGMPLYLKYSGKLGKSAHAGAAHEAHDDVPGPGGDSESQVASTTTRRGGDAYISLIGDDDLDEDEGKLAKIVPSDDHGGHHGETFGDVMIHNAIHTIEFVLGAVSNTASYLRLWALSLAHAQLSHVFWDKMLAEYGYLKSGPFLVIGFAAWFGATVGVLLGMDSLECFLHSLRLHWVEFQNKFYSADGYMFKPFSTNEIAPTLYHTGMSRVLTEEEAEAADEERERQRQEDEQWHQQRVAMMKKDPTIPKLNEQSVSNLSTPHNVNIHGQSAVQDEPDASLIGASLMRSDTANTSGEEW